jgi:hypothetical protein
MLTFVKVHVSHSNPLCRVLYSILLHDSGETVMGVCGSSCEGKDGIDTIGVYEFDTATDTIVATHQMVEGVGGDPYPSPDGSE